MDQLLVTFLEVAGVVTSGHVFLKEDYTDEDAQICDVYFQLWIIKKTDVLPKLIEHKILQVRKRTIDDVDSINVVDYFLAGGLAHEDCLNGVSNDVCRAGLQRLVDQFNVAEVLWLSRLALH